MATSPHKKDGTLKKQYKDMPRFQVILGYEKDFTDKFDASIKMMIKEVGDTASKMIDKWNK